MSLPHRERRRCHSVRAAAHDPTNAVRDRKRRSLASRLVSRSAPEAPRPQPKAPSIPMPDDAWGYDEDERGELRFYDRPAVGHAERPRRLHPQL